MASMWTNKNTLPDGHTLFFTDTRDYPDLVAIADESGDTPEATDDGVLWLDFERPLMAGSKNFSIPLKTPDSEETRTATDFPTLVLLASWFNWPVNVRGVLFNIARRDNKAKFVVLALVLEELEEAGLNEAAAIVSKRFS